jgi:DNA polymerase III epsilon subunit-like protein
MLDGQRLVVVDVEGNGQQPPEIVEIAVLPLNGTTPAQAPDLRTWLVRPARPITSIVTRKAHGIRNQDVAACPPWREVAPDVAAALEGRVLVAHNAAVERRVLAAHLPGWEPPQVLDTMRLAKSMWPELGRYGLDPLIDHAGITPPTVESSSHRHRAGYDTLLTVELFLALVETATDRGLGWDQVVTAAQLNAAKADPAAPEGGLW